MPFIEQIFISIIIGIGSSSIASLIIVRFLKLRGKLSRTQFKLIGYALIPLLMLSLIFTIGILFIEIGITNRSLKDLAILISGLLFAAVFFKFNKPKA